MDNKKLVKMIHVYSDGSVIVHDVKINDVKDSEEEVNNIFKKKIEEFEKIPYQPYLPYYQYPSPVVPLQTKCSKCGMSLENMMGYVCPNYGCPIYPQVYC